MLKIRIPSEKSEGTWVDFTTRGQAISLLIRPVSVSTYQKVEKKHTNYEWVRDSETKKMVKVSEVNRDSFMEEIVDLMLIDFKGITVEDEKGISISSNSSKAKRALIENLYQPEGERPIINFLIDESRKLSNVIEEEQEEQIKNS